MPNKSDNNNKGKERSGQVPKHRTPPPPPPPKTAIKPKKKK